MLRTVYFLPFNFELGSGPEFHTMGAGLLFPVWAPILFWIMSGFRPLRSVQWSKWFGLSLLIGVPYFVPWVLIVLNAAGSHAVTLLFGLPALSFGILATDAITSFRKQPPTGRDHLKTLNWSLFAVYVALLGYGVFQEFWGDGTRHHAWIGLTGVGRA